MLATLRSSDGQDFFVDPDILKHSGTLSAFEYFTEPITLPNVTGEILQLVIEWLEHHKDDPVEEIDDRAEIILPTWDRNFLEPLQYTSKAIEITVASSYLEIKKLMGMACRAIADTFKGKTGDQIGVE